MADYREILRRLTLRDDRYVADLLAGDLDSAVVSPLDAKTHALVQLGALIALDGGPASYQWVVDAAVEAGASADEIVGTLVAVVPTTGVPRITSAAPKLGLALDYDVEAALEELDTGT